MKRIGVLLIIYFMASCSETFVPPGLYDYQVERLITNGDSKSWVLQSLVIDGQNVEVLVCDSTITFLAEVVRTDSLVFLEINKRTDCSANDTIFWGAIEASGHVRDLFNDTLYFNGGVKPSFGLIESITPASFILLFNNGSTSERYLLGLE